MNKKVENLMNIVQSGSKEEVVWPQYDMPEHINNQSVGWEQD